VALGNTAQLNLASINQQLASDAQFQRSYYDWLKRKFAEWNATLSTAAQQSSFGITAAADQNQLNVFIGDLNRQILLFEGGSPSVSNIVNDLAQLLGIG
jgi:hypothetical protein